MLQTKSKVDTVRAFCVVLPIPLLLLPLSLYELILRYYKHLKNSVNIGTAAIFTHISES